MPRAPRGVRNASPGPPGLERHARASLGGGSRWPRRSYCACLPLRSRPRPGAAYALIPEDLRGETHLRIGMLLAEHTPPLRLEETIFDIVNQLNRASHLIAAGDRERVARLNLIAGQRAKGSTAYASALKYLKAARAQLSEIAWEHSFSLIFTIEQLLAECELLTAEMDAAERRLSMLARRASAPHDVAVITRLQLTLYTTIDRSDLAIDVFLDYLRRA